MKNFTNIQTVFNKQHIKLYTYTVALASLLCCFNGSVVTTSSSESSTDPDINFYGKLEDHAHNTDVQFIVIGGKYESIPVYQQINMSTDIAHKDIDPKQNRILINLQDIKSIALEHPNSPTASAIQINGKTYIQIIIEFIHGTKKKYLVESTRKITCKEIDKSAETQDTPTFQTRDINFIHVKKLIIQGFKSNHPYQAPQLSPTDKEFSTKTIDKHMHTSSNSKQVLQDKKDFKNNAAELLHAIEENVKNLPMDNPSAFETMQATILTLLKSLKDQLQKFLDMIK